MAYAENTKVSVSQSRVEIEKLLQKYGADQMASGWTQNRAVISFRMHSRYIKIEMPLPILEKDVSSWNRKKGQYYDMVSVEKETRRRWRSILLYCKAKLESVESNIVSFEEAFMAHILLPNKQTVAQFMGPQIQSAYTNGQMPKLLPGVE